MAPGAIDGGRGHQAPNHLRNNGLRHHGDGTRLPFILALLLMPMACTAFLLRSHPAMPAPTVEHRRQPSWPAEPAYGADVGVGPGVSSPRVRRGLSSQPAQAGSGSSTSSGVALQVRGTMGGYLW